jgi:hypothetical protein
MIFERRAFDVSERRFELTLSGMQRGACLCNRVLRMRELFA